MEYEKKYPSLKIQNIVMSGSIAESLDIEYITSKLDGCVFTRKKFPGAVYHIKEPKIVALLFTSGKIVLTGISCVDESQKGLAVLISRINGLGIRTSPEPDVSITNMVCSSIPGRKLTLLR